MSEENDEEYICLINEEEIDPEVKFLNNFS